MGGSFDRRSFLARGAAVGAGLAAAGSTGSLLAACGSSSSGSSSSTAGSHGNGVSSATPKPGGTLIFGTEAEEKGFSPTLGTFDTTGILYARTVFDPLAIIAADGRTVLPYLAQSITPNSDFTTWTVTLRPNVVFHNGAPCDGAALLANFEAQKKSLLTGPALTPIDTMTQSGPLAVTVTMKSPWVPFDYYLAGGIGGQVAFVAEPNWLAKGEQSNPIGTGPFVFQEWVPNDHFTATKNPHYWRPNLPYLNTITYKPIPDAQQLYSSLQTGTVDIIHTSNAQVTGELNSSSYAFVNDSEKVAGEPDMGCLLLNLSTAPFNNLKVRQAAAMAVSSEQYVKVIDQGGLNKTSNGPFVEGSPFFGPTGYPAYNPSQAKSLIEQVKQQTGQPVTLAIGHVPDANTTKIAEYIQAQFQNAGMQVTLTPVQQADLINKALQGSFQCFVWRQFGATDPDINYIFWSPTQINSVFSINMARNTDPNMETALIKGRQSPSASDRNAAYQQVGQLMGSDIPYIWLDRAVWSIGAQSRVENFNNPTAPGGAAAFGMITGAVWPTQIWLSS
jgi:ABC-type transport system substrate-binding protein